MEKMPFSPFYKMFSEGIFLTSDSNGLKVGFIWERVKFSHQITAKWAQMLGIIFKRKEGIVGSGENIGHPNFLHFYNVYKSHL